MTPNAKSGQHRRHGAQVPEDEPVEMTSIGNWQGLEDWSKPGVDRDWVRRAIQTLEADSVRSADTHLQRLPLPDRSPVHLYAKDESGHPTGSLKHRLARSLLLYGLCNGWIGPTTTLVEASSGSTAVSEAYLARLLDLPFIAVMPSDTSPEKLALIERHGGRCHLVTDGSQVAAEARQIAADTGGHFLDQFTYAERATDWRGNNNIAEATFEQMRREQHPEPAWIVIGAGTGGTSATFGRYVRWRGHKTRIAVVDPAGSAFLEGWRDGRPGATASGSRIEGVGRPRVEASFEPRIVDRMIKLPDKAALAGMRWAQQAVGRTVGPSTGLNLYAALRLCAEMAKAGEAGSVVTLLCDSGSRYETTWGDAAWCQRNGLDAPLPIGATIHDLLAVADSPNKP
jgi:cysteine synthase A